MSQAGAGPAYMRAVSNTRCMPCASANATAPALPGITGTPHCSASDRAHLVAEQGELVRRWADEHQPGFGTGLREIGTLAEKAVARVHRVAAFGAGDGDERRDVEVRRRASRVERNRLAGQLHMKRLRIVAGEDGDARDVEIAQRAHQPHRDLTAVGHKNLLEHESPY